MKLPGNRSPVQLLCAVRSILDFLYLAQLPTHTNKTLQHLQTALETFHSNKSIFIDLGVRKNFNLPKLHSLQHYVSCIESLGTTNNYNTENTERLHIDFAKDAYHATNRKDELPQMTLWLERKEKVLIHQVFIELISTPKSPPIPPIAPSTDFTTPPSINVDESNEVSHIHMTKTPSVCSVHFDQIISEYGAIDFRQALTVFIASYNQPTLSRRQLQNEAFKVFLPFQKVPIFHKVKLWNDDPLSKSEGKKTLDVIHSRPRVKTKKGAKLPAHFDTALIDVAADPGGGVTGNLILSYNTSFSLFL